MRGHLLLIVSASAQNPAVVRVEPGGHIVVKAGGTLHVGDPLPDQVGSTNSSGPLSGSTTPSASAPSSAPGTGTCAPLAPCLWQYLPDTRIQATSPYWAQVSEATYISAVYEGVLRSSSDASAEGEECFYQDRQGTTPNFGSTNYRPSVPTDRLHNWYSDVGSVSPGDNSCGIVPATLKCCLNPSPFGSMNQWAYPFVVHEPSPWVMITLWNSLNDHFLWDNSINSMEAARAKVDAFFDGGGYNGAQTGGSAIAVLASSLAVFDSGLTTDMSPEPFLLYQQFPPCGSYCQDVGPGPTYAEMVPANTQNLYPNTQYGLLSNFAPMGNGAALPGRTDAWVGHTNPNMPAENKFWIIKLIKSGNADERQILEARPYTHGVPWD